MDNANIKGLRRFMPTRRRLIQLYAALLYNAHAKGFIEGDIYTGPLKGLCVPGFNCYSCPGAIGACPLGALQNALASSSARAPFFMLGILMLLGLTLGRTICGFLCPLGLIQELVYKLPVPKLRKSRVTRALSYMKYVVLGVFVVAIPLIYGAKHLPVPGFCKYICPAGTLEGAIGLLSNPANAGRFSMLGVLFTRKFIILILTLLVCVFAYRAFCRFLCPLGAIYGMFSRLSLLGVRVDAAKCTHCGRCVAHCKMDVCRVGDHECIHCGECACVCTAGAIEWHAGRARIAMGDARKSRRRIAIAWLCALAVLVGVGIYVNRPTEAPEQVQVDVIEETPVPEAEDVPVSVADDTPVGAEVGMRCPTFEIDRQGGEGGTIASEACLGKPTIINFWATWCGPCVKELPYFEEIHQKYGDAVNVIAIHAYPVTEDVAAYIERAGYTFDVGNDKDGKVIRSLGGSTMLPMTVVLDARGHIVYNEVGSVTFEGLDSLVRSALG